MKELYRKYISRSFFRKIFIVYVVITIMTGQILFVVISRNLMTIKYDQALIMSDQIIATVDNFLVNKMTGALSIHQRLYRDKETWTLLVSELQNPGSNELSAYQQQELRRIVSNTMYGIDKDFNGLFLGGYGRGNVIQYGSGQTLIENKFFTDCLIKGRESGKQIQLVSARNEKSPGNAFSVFLFSTVKSPDYSKDIGTLAVFFNAMNIRQSYQAYEEYLKGNLYIFDEKGELLFDSTAAYDLPESFPETGILRQSTERQTLDEWVYNTYYAQNNGYYVVNAFALKAIRDDIKIPQRTMLGVFALALLAAVFLNYISTKFFAKRLKPITDTIEQIKEGHLTSFSIQKKYDDEVGYIYTELLQMCAALDDHIQKEYVYRLRQKEMELYTLQAQIDPHFLYNTLEAIRMKLYVKGETEASKMIWILSDLFRNMMKKDVVVTNRDELNYLQSYLELFQFRLGSRMKYKFEIAQEVYRYATIKHILQPVIENALVHGIQDAATQENPSTILIQGNKEGEDIIFIIRDDGCGIEREKLSEIRERLDNSALFQDSIGIYNVSSRLRIVYGYSYKLRIESEAGRGTAVTVRIKAMKKKELEEYVQTIDY